jgi:hypothetical protein
MIYLNLLIDYLLCNLCSIYSYFIFIELDTKKIFDVIICGLIISFIYNDFLFLFILVFIYYFFRLVRFKKKYFIIKNIFIIFVYELIINVLHIFL